MIFYWECKGNDETCGIKNRKFALGNEEFNIAITWILSNARITAKFLWILQKYSTNAYSETIFGDDRNIQYDWSISVKAMLNFISHASYHHFSE